MHDLELEWRFAHPEVIGARERFEIDLRSELARSRLAAVRYQQIPSAAELHLASGAAATEPTPQDVAPGLSSPLLEEARRLKAFDDFKTLSDLRRRPSVELDVEFLRTRLGVEKQVNPETRRQALREYVARHYELPPISTDVDPALFSPRWRLEHPRSSLSAAFDYVESHWSILVRNASQPDGSTLIPSPYPVTVPAGRFRESYYWDTCFGCEGLLATGRGELARMQADNLLESIRRFGFVPNGQRQYYLSRSQPPLSAMLVRNVVRHSHREFSQNGDAAGSLRLHRWLRERAVPLLEKELFEFWGNPETRFDVPSGLHHHWDDIEVDRPERHSSETEAELGASLRDVRAMAESGLDFTAIYNGDSGRNEISRIAPVLLNSILYRYAKDLAWLADTAALEPTRRRCHAAAQEKRTAINRHLWSEEQGSYRHLHLATGRQSIGSCFTVFSPLWAGVCDAQRAARVVQDGMSLLRVGGLASSSLDSANQWDGSNGWAPAQMLAVAGLRNYGYQAEAEDLANRWAETVAGVHSQCGLFIERMDVIECAIPKTHFGQYPVQPGFLWTNASFAWMVADVLDHPLVEAAEAPPTPPTAEEELRAA